MPQAGIEIIKSVLQHFFLLGLLRLLLCYSYLIFIFHFFVSHWELVLS